MSFSVKKSTQFKINELVIMTKAGPIDVSQIFEELNLFDSILMPVTSGNILIRDSVGLSGKLLFDGSESILIDIAKDAKSDIATFKKAFRIYKQSGRKAEGLNTELFVLNFVSDELIFSDQQRINQSFEGTYSKVVEKVLVDYLRVPNNQIGGIFEPTTGIRKLVIPNLKPLDAIEWCAKRSVPSKVVSFDELSRVASTEHHEGVCFEAALFHAVDRDIGQLLELGIAAHRFAQLLWR
jgi:hypothetical protein